MKVPPVLKYIGTLFFFLGASLPVLIGIFVLLPKLATDKTWWHPLLAVWGGFCYLFLWYLIIYLLYIAAANLYGWQQKSLIGSSEEDNADFFALFRGVITYKDMFEGLLATITGLFLSYVYTIYGFAVVYAYSSLWYPKSFNRDVDFPASLYFSLVTIATAGYGEMYPENHWTQLFVSIEILLGLFYTTFFFAVIAGHAQQNGH